MEGADIPKGCSRQQITNNNKPHALDVPDPYLAQRSAGSAVALGVRLSSLGQKRILGKCDPKEGMSLSCKVRPYVPLVGYLDSFDEQLYSIQQ